MRVASAAAEEAVQGDVGQEGVTVFAFCPPLPSLCEHCSALSRWPALSLSLRCPSPAAFLAACLCLCLSVVCLTVCLSVPAPHKSMHSHIRIQVQYNHCNHSALCLLTDTLCLMSASGVRSKVQNNQGNHCSRRQGKKNLFFYLRFTQMNQHY